MTLQEIVFALERFWSDRGCLIHQPWDAEVGAGTMHPETFFRVLGPRPWKVGYVQPSRRPADGRYEVIFQWRREDNNWRLASARWSDAGRPGNSSGK